MGFTKNRGTGSAKLLMAFSFFSGLLTNGIWSFQVDRIPIFTGWPTAAMFNRLRQHQGLLPMLALLVGPAKYLTGPYRIEFLARAETRMTWSRPPWWWGPSIAKMSTRPSRAWPPTPTWLRLPEPRWFCKWTVSILWSWWWTRTAAAAQLHYAADTTSNNRSGSFSICALDLVCDIMQIDPNVSVKQKICTVWAPFGLSKKLEVERKGTVCIISSLSQFWGCGSEVPFYMCSLASSLLCSNATRSFDKRAKFDDALCEWGYLAAAACR